MTATVPGSTERVLAVMSDLHANATAVAAVIGDATEAGADEWWVLGDVVAMGPQPTAVAVALQALDRVAYVRGNGDRYLLTGTAPFPHDDDVARDPSLRPRQRAVEGSLAWTTAELQAAGHLAWLASFPDAQRTLLPDGTRVLGVHASLRSDDGVGIAPATPDDELRDLFAGCEADVVVAGHTHRITDRTVDGVRMVNPGSVGNPVVADNTASYALIRADLAGYEIDVRPITYDLDAVRASIRRCGIPNAAYLLSHYS